MAEVLGQHWHVAPAEQGQTLVADRLGDDLLDSPKRLIVLGHEEMPDPVAPRIRQLDPKRGAFLGEEAVRDLD
jgi:hypothetical protein